MSHNYTPFPVWPRPSDEGGGTIPSTAADVGAVPTGRTINGYDLTANRTLTATDVGAAASADALGYVNHGATSGTARPTGYAAIVWVGTVEPTNAINGDI